MSNLIDRLIEDGSDLCLEAVTEIKYQRNRATNAEYMQQAYYNMLGPVALKVASGWYENNVKRFHCSWGDEAYKLSGEERAQAILDFQNAPSRQVDNIDIE